MASPLSIFRKNQRAMMAVFGVLLMIAFLLGGLAGGLDSLYDGGRYNALVATSTVRNFYQADVAGRMQQRRMCQAFLIRVGVAAAMQRQFQIPPDKFSPELVMQLERSFGPQVAMSLQGFLRPLSDRDVVESMLLADEAVRRGIAIDDAAVIEFIRGVSGNLLNSDQLMKILGTLGSIDRGVTLPQLYDALRFELSVSQILQLELAMPRQSPLERWYYFNQLKRRATVELVSLPVSSMLPEAGTPKEPDLQRLYEAHKDHEAVPGSPDPGFKVPHLVAFEYFKADYNKFYDENAVSEEEISAHYEKFKDQQYLYRGFDSREDEAAEAKPTAENKPAAESKPADNQKPAAEKPASDKPASENKPAAESKPEPKPESKSESKPAPEKKESPESKPEPTSPPKPDSNDGSRFDAPASFNQRVLIAAANSQNPADRLLALVDEVEQPRNAEQSKSAEQPKSEPTQPAAEGAKPAAAPKEPAVTKDPDVPKGAEAPTTPATGTPAGEKPKTSISKAPILVDHFELPRDIRSGATPKHDPLWKVHDEIRSQLARDKAISKMETALNGINKQKGALREYLNKRAALDRRKKEGEKIEGDTSIAPPDFEALAKQAGVEFKTIPASNALQVRQTTDIGASVVANQSFVEYTYRSLDNFLPLISQDNDENRYMFWKTEDKPAAVPTFAEARAQVEHAWKMIAARKPLQAQADQLAAEARAAKKPFKDFMTEKGYEVTRSNPFSWLTTGSAGAAARGVPPTISEVDGTVDVGDEFMKAVFNLEEGQIAVTWNHPQTTAYVVQLAASEPSTTILRELYLTDRADEYAPAAGVEAQHRFDTWHKHWTERIRLKFLRDPVDLADER